MSAWASYSVASIGFFEMGIAFVLDECDAFKDNPFALVVLFFRTTLVIATDR